jgi:UDP-3-O-[3-hydroxymyristoyl] glucosamine N-acyltransferase
LELCTIDEVTGDTIIGEGTKLDNQVHVGTILLLETMLNRFSNRYCRLCIIKDRDLLFGAGRATSGITIGEKEAVILD